MPAVTDYHLQVRDAVARSLRAAAGLPPVVTLDDPEAEVGQVALPALVVACVGPDRDAPSLGTNASDGIGYSVALLLMGSGTPQSRGGPMPDMTLFRRVTRNTFNNKRLSGVTQVAWCEVSDSGPIWDDKGPAFTKLQTALVVTAFGRFPRS